MKIASWNVNSVKARLPHLLAFLGEAQPDVLCLQETKCPEADFPTLEIRALGYHVETIGQRAYNGVALLSKLPAEEIVRGLPGMEGDEQARYIEASFGDGPGRLDLPARTAIPVGTDKFTYKLAWMEQLAGRARESAAAAKSRSCWPATTTSARPTTMCTTRWPCATTRCAASKSRARFRALMYLGLTDAYRVFHREPHRYTFWDYQAGRWHRDEGLRIDHLLLSPHAADRVAACEIDKSPRAKDRASDHTPIWCELAV